MGITFKINVQFILNEYDEKLNFKQKKIKTMNDEMFQRILDEPQIRNRPHKMTQRSKR